MSTYDLNEREGACARAGGEGVAHEWRQRIERRAVSITPRLDPRLHDLPRIRKNSPCYPASSPSKLRVRSGSQPGFWATRTHAGTCNWLPLLKQCRPLSPAVADARARAQACRHPLTVLHWKLFEEPSPYVPSILRYPIIKGSNNPSRGTGMCTCGWVYGCARASAHTQRVHT